MILPPSENRYILCKFVAKTEGKTDKIPLNPNTLTAHDPLDPTIHLSYEEAYYKQQALGDGYGIGFVIVRGDNYFFIDLDNCLNPDGTWNELALYACAQFPTAFVEISHSGRGLHIIGRFEGEAPPHSCRDTARGLEIYTEGRFCALTFTQGTGNAQSIHTEALGRFVEEMGFTKTPTASPDQTDWTTDSDPQYNVPQDDDQLIQFIMERSLTARESFGAVVPFKPLWENDVAILAQHFPTKTLGKPYDQSAADLALAIRLHYYTGGNCERVLRLMNKSGLVRDKWQYHGDYLPRTIKTARGAKTDFFKHVPPRTQGEYNQKLTTRLLQRENYPELSSNMKVQDTTGNLRFLLDMFRIETRWNVMSRRREILFPEYIKLFEEERDNASITVLKNLAILNEMPVQRIDEHIDLLAQDNQIHPIVDGLKRNPWDGVHRLDTFLATITCENPELSYRLIRRWMVSAIAAAHSEKGFSASGVLVLEGPQYIGKTRFIKSLDPFNCDAVKGGAILDPTNKDCLLTLSRYWIAELGELDATFRKADIARIKSYLTEDVDVVRTPFARKDSFFYRRTVFAASVNDSKFLVDQTGNRRWWTIPVTHINLKHGLDMAQVWAEVYCLWKAGERPFLDDEEFELLNIRNKNHGLLDPLEELLEAHFDFTPGWNTHFQKLSKLTSSEVLRVLGYQQPTRAQATRMGIILIEKTGKQPNRRTHYLRLKS